MNKKRRVAVLMGGRSPEYEISLISGREVVKNLDPKKYDVFPIVISKDGVTWQIQDKSRFLQDPPAKAEIRYQESENKSLTIQKQKDLITNQKIDIAFIAMHGPYGEDGTVQGFLEFIGIPYIGSGVLASALSMDKISSRKLFTQAGLKTPEYLIFEKGDNFKKIFKRFSPPIFVKPSNQGSSIGSSKVYKLQDLKKALELALSFSPFALIEEYLEGTEVTGSILGNDKPRALPLVEIIPTREFFDYKAKYNDQETQEIVPARLSQKITKKAQNTAILAFKTLGCCGFGRVDMIIKKGDVFVLEVNTIPGLTPMSLLPKAAKAAGIFYPQLLDKIIQFAQE